MRRRVKIVALPVVAAIVLAIGASNLITAIHNWAAFGTFDTAGPPSRVDYCGRRYYPDGNVDSLGQVEAFLASNNTTGVTQVETAPSGMPIVANVMAPAVRARYRTNVCTMSLWVKAGPDAYAAYGLSGGS